MQFLCIQLIKIGRLEIDSTSVSELLLHVFVLVRTCSFYCNPNPFNMDQALNQVEASQAPSWAMTVASFAEEVGVLQKNILDDFSFSFEKADQLGSGQNGFVYTCSRVSDGREFAVKMLPITEASFRELRAWKACSQHPHVVPLVAVYGNFIPAEHFLLKGLRDNFPQGTDIFIAIMEKMRNGDLYGLIEKASGPLSDELIGNIISQTSSALSHIQACGYVHGDMKLENVLIESMSPLHLRVSDFGFARHFLSQPTPTGKNFTRDYIAPETLQSFERFDSTGSFSPVGPTSDVWSLGVMTFMLLTRTAPFAGLPTEPGWRSQRMLTPHHRRSVLTCALPRAGARWARLSVAARTVVERLLVVDSRERPHAAEVGDIAAAMRGLLAGPRARLLTPPIASCTWPAM